MRASYQCGIVVRLLFRLNASLTSRSAETPYSTRYEPLSPVYSLGHCVDALSVYSVCVLSRCTLSSMDQTASLYRPAASFCAIKTFHQYLIRICLRIGQNFP